MNLELSEPTRHPRRILILLLATGLLIRLLIAWSSFTYLSTRGPLIDDSFYLLSIARHLASGQGFTADGVHATSGFQPLYTLLLVPLYWMAPEDRILPIHLALTLLALCGTATGWLVFRIVRRLASSRAALFSLTLWTFSPYFLSQGLNGLETGLFGLLFAFTLDRHLEYRVRLGPGQAARLGLLVGLTCLARVDGVILAVSMLVDLLRRHLPPARLRAVLLMGATALATLLPYLLFLGWRFGSLLPESGSATRLLSFCYGTRFVFGPRSLAFFPLDHVPWLYYLGSLRKAVQTLGGEPLLFPASLLVASASLLGFFNPRTWFRLLVAALLLLGNLAALRRPLGSGNDPWRGFARVGGVCTLLWIPAYAFGALGQWWFGRYFFPLFLLMILASGVALDRLGQGLAPLRRMGPKRWLGIALVAHLTLFAVQAPERFFRHKPQLNVAGYLEAARILDAHLPPGARGGAFQSGTIGYFSRNSVINLDGVINADASRALREGRMADYIVEEGIAAVIDWPWILEALLVRRSRPGAAEGLGTARQVGPFLLIEVQREGSRLASHEDQK